jgi:hypothetical protein
LIAQRQYDREINLLIGRYRAQHRGASGRNRWSQMVMEGLNRLLSDAESPNGQRYQKQDEPK